MTMNNPMKFQGKIQTEKNREYWLDSMRGLACLIVMFAHIFASIPAVGVRASGCGKIGVWLFFIMSGFWAWYPYCGERRFAWKETGTFYLKRALRIYPMYLCVLLLGMLIGYGGLELHSVLRHLFLLEGIGHFWAIPVEMKFYLILPVILWFLSRFKNSIVRCGVCLGMAFVTALLFPYTEYVENSVGLFWYLPVFLMGMW